jgi:serine O-acetyltransferase
MFDNLRRDKAAYMGLWYRRAGFWIVAIYRFGNWADSLPSVFLRVPMWALYLALKATLSLFVSNIVLWSGRRGSRIGPGLCLFHAHSIMIPRGAEIGEDCQIYHEVTLGTGQIPGTPRIGNRVTIYPGARILGGVAIGDDAVVGANCVVTRDVPKEMVVLAAPSRPIPRTLSPEQRRWNEGREPLPSLSQQPPTPSERL